MVNTKFIIDKQTFDDLQLYSNQEKSVFHFFDLTITEGGKEFLETLFFSSLSSATEIQERQKKIQQMTPFIDEALNFDRISIKDLEKYLNDPLEGFYDYDLLNVFKINSPEYYYSKRYITEIIEILNIAESWFNKIYTLCNDESLRESINEVRYCLQKINSISPKAKSINVLNIRRYNNIIKQDILVKIKRVFLKIYELDAYLSIAKAIKNKDFCFPDVFPKNQTQCIDIKGVYHLFNDNPVKNNIVLKKEKRIWFLTGANMAGKSTLIKAIAIALYLTHIGFPVPGKNLKTDVLDGLLTSINLSDNLTLGYSHFYNEIIRLKSIISQIHQNTNIFIILDELFNGTNNDDASQGIIEIINRFEKIENPFIIISSHITVLSDKLADKDIIEFITLKIGKDTKGLPMFKYEVTEGVANEKLGMWLLNRSGIFNIFDNLINN